MKSNLLFAALLPLMAGAQTSRLDVAVTNTLDFDRTDAPVVVSLDSTPFAVSSAVVKVGGKEIASQLDDLDRDGRADELAFVVDIPANGHLEVDVELSAEGKQKAYKPRTFSQMLVRGWHEVPVSIGDISVDGNCDSYTLLYGHGVMFESELNGYRIYFDPKQTLDPYGKFTKQLELEQSQFYPTDSMVAAGFGNDVLMVGETCGIGALKGWDGKGATHVAPVARRWQRPIASGPVRAIVEIGADGWEYAGDKLDMRQRFTQWAGHRDVDVDVDFSRPLSEDAEFAVGVQEIFGDESTHHRGPWGTVASWGRYWPMGDTVLYKKEWIGMATYVPERYAKLSAADKGGHYYIMRAPAHTHINYSTMFTSEHEGAWGYPDAEAWYAVLPKWKQEKDAPLLVTVRRKH